MKADRVRRVLWPALLGAAFGAFFGPWTASYWWPSKTISVKEHDPHLGLHATEVQIEVPPQLRVAQIVGPIVGGIAGCLAAIAARRAEQSV